MAQQQQGQGNGGDNSLDLLWVMVLIVVIIGATWYFGKDYITAFVLTIRYYEILLIKWLAEFYGDIAKFLGFSQPDFAVINEWLAFIDDRPASVAFQTLKDVSTFVGIYFRYPVLIILSGLGVLIYFTHVTLKFKHIFNMNRMRSIALQVWPFFAPTTKKNLVKADLEKGPWAMATTPMDFCKKHNLIEIEIKDGVHTVKLLKGPAHRMFALQLGPIWQGTERLPIHLRALFAIFAARGNRDSDSASKLLEQIAVSSGGQQLNFAGVDALLNKYENSKLVQLVLSRHGYVSTVMASMLELARTDGVLATSEFLWLKPYDRRMWYILNSIGRRTAAAEAAGPFSHWLAENRFARSLKVPMVDEAVKAMEIALAEILYEPEED